MWEHHKQDVVIRILIYTLLYKDLILTKIFLKQFLFQKILKI